MTGNEAVARGFWEAGGRVVSAYPGTPSTEITENAAKYQELYAEWAPNEKVALEVAIGASMGGARSLAAMKHVGLNVAADPLFTVAYTGVNGGLIIVSADDPGMHSSQNEQDNRNYARAAKIPALEPADSSEAKEFTKLGLVLSEQFDTPVMLRLTTRIAHSQSFVELEDREESANKTYKKDISKYVMTPAGARPRHVLIESRMEALAEFAATGEINRAEYRSKDIGVICAGAVYQYVREALPDASVYKLGMIYPLSYQSIIDFANQVKKLYVIEELDPFIENILKSWGIECIGKDIFSLCGEIFPETIAGKLAGCPLPEISENPNIPPRPPVMCAGCPHRAVFYMFNKLKLTVTGDIGCYTLAAAPPLAAIDSTVCMGASIGMAHGLEKALGRDSSVHTVAVLGESTFIHSGITSLINTVYNQSAVTTVILDNHITAMTGHQNNPASGYNAKGQAAPALDLAALVKACGVPMVNVVDPFDLAKSERVLKESLAFDGPSVIIYRQPCVLLGRTVTNTKYEVNRQNCIGCKICLKCGCPALGYSEGKAVIDQQQCTGCGLCAGLCPKETIEAVKKEGK